MIALLCPTRARPEQCKKMLNSVYATASNKGGVFPYIALTDGFADSPLILDSDTTNTFIRTPDGMPTAYKWNVLAELALKSGLNHKLFMLCADDIVFQTPCWDKALLDHYNALENKIHVYHLRDGRTGHGTPHPIVTREYIEAMGYFLPPLFLHWFVDTWTVEIAKAAHCFTHLTDYMLDHIKPSDEGKPDETHSRIRQWGWHDRDVWVDKHSQHILEFEKRRLQANIISQQSMAERLESRLKSFGVMG